MSGHSDMFLTFSHVFYELSATMLWGRLERLLCPLYIPYFITLSQEDSSINITALCFIESENEVTQSCLTLWDPWTVVYQAPQSMEFSRQEYWSGLPFPSPEDLPNPGIEPESPALQADALPSEPPRKPYVSFSSVAQSCLTLCNPMNHSSPGLPVHH